MSVLDYVGGRETNDFGYIDNYKLNIDKLSFIRKLCESCKDYNFKLQDIFLGYNCNGVYKVATFTTLSDFENFYSEDIKEWVNITLLDLNSLNTDIIENVYIRVSEESVYIEHTNISSISSMDKLLKSL